MNDSALDIEGPVEGEWDFAVGKTRPSTGLHAVSIFKWIEKASAPGELRKQAVSFQCIGRPEDGYAEAAAQMMVNALNKKIEDKNAVSPSIVFKARKSRKFEEQAQVKGLRASLTLIVGQVLGPGHPESAYEI